MTKPQDMNGFDDEAPAIQPPVQESQATIDARLKAVGLDPNSMYRPVSQPMPTASPTAFNPNTVKGGNWFPVKGLPSGRTDYIGRPLTYKEIKKLSYANEDTIDETLLSISKDAVRSPITNSPVLDCDLRYIFLWLRSNTLLDPRFDMVYTCTKCDKEASFKLEPVEIDVVNHEGTGLAEGFILSDGTTSIEIGLPSAQRMHDASTINALYAEEEDIEIDSLIAGHVLRVSVLDDQSPVKVFEWLEEQAPDLVLKVHEIAKKYMKAGVIERVNKICPHCHEKQIVELDMTAVFFFPTV